MAERREAGHTRLERGVRGRGLQERDGGPRLPHARRRPRLRPRQHGLQLREVCRHAHGQRHGPEPRRPAHGRDTQRRGDMVPQRGEPAPRLALRADGGRRQPRAHQGVCRQPDVGEHALRGIPRDRPHAGTDAQHGRQLRLPGRLAAQPFLHPALRHHAQHHGLRPQQLHSTARRPGAGREAPPAGARRIRQLRHQLGLPHHTRGPGAAAGERHARRLDCPQGRRPDVQVRGAAAHGHRRPHRPDRRPGRRPHQGRRLCHKQPEDNNGPPRRVDKGARRALRRHGRDVRAGGGTVQKARQPRAAIPGRHRLRRGEAGRRQGRAHLRAAGQAAPGHEVAGGPDAHLRHMAHAEGADSQL